MKIVHTLTAAGLISVLAYPALAATSAQSTIRQLPDAGSVIIAGTIDKVKDDKNFVLKDGSGSIDVEVAFDNPPALVEGDRVSVIGNVDKGFFSKEVDATSISLNQ